MRPVFRRSSDTTSLNYSFNYSFGFSFTTGSSSSTCSMDSCNVLAIDEVGDYRK
jgi:hypothetical protein